MGKSKGDIFRHQAEDLLNHGEVVATVAKAMLKALPEVRDEAAREALGVRLRKLHSNVGPLVRQVQDIIANGAGAYAQPAPEVPETETAAAADAGAVGPGQEEPTDTPGGEEGE